MGRRSRAGGATRYRGAMRATCRCRTWNRSSAACGGPSARSRPRRGRGTVVLAAGLGVTAGLIARCAAGYGSGRAAAAWRARAAAAAASVAAVVASSRPRGPVLGARRAGASCRAAGRALLVGVALMPLAVAAGRASRCSPRAARCWCSARPARCWPWLRRPALPAGPRRDGRRRAAVAGRRAAHRPARRGPARAALLTAPGRAGVSRPGRHRAPGTIEGP